MRDEKYGTRLQGWKMHCLQLENARPSRQSACDSMAKGAITSKIKHAINHKTIPARLAQLLQPSLAFCFSLQPMTVYRPILDGTSSLAASSNKMLMRAATVVQVLQDLFYVLLQVLFYL